MASILLIDDDALLRETLATVLVSSGHRVVQAGNGREGALLFRAARPDLVITDILMPEREGIETIIALHRERPELPILAMTGNPHGANYLALAARLGARATLAKPFSAEALLRAVDDLLTPRPQPPSSA